MPFKSKAQQKWMFANHPEMAKRWADHTLDIKKLPETVDTEKKSYITAAELGKMAADTAVTLGAGGLGALAGAGLGGLYGAFSTPEKGRSRFGGMLRGALGGTLAGGLGGAALGHFNADALNNLGARIAETDLMRRHVIAPSVQEHMRKRIADNAAQGNWLDAGKNTLKATAFANAEPDQQIAMMRDPNSQLYATTQKPFTTAMTEVGKRMQQR
jgi:hypothetical protein